MINIKNLQNLLTQIADEKGLEEKTVEAVLSDALALAYKKDYLNKDDRIEAQIGAKSGKVNFYLLKTVVTPDQVVSGEVKFNTHKYVMLDEAKTIEPAAQTGDEIKISLPYREDFSRIAAQTAKQVISQRLKDVERGVVFERFKDKEGQVITGTIQKIDIKAIYVDLGKTTGIMFKNETIPGEVYRVQMRMRFYIYGVESTSRGVEVFLSRSHPLFIPAIFRIEVPEISEAIVEIKDVARLPGVRTKMAVASKVEGIDGVGACIGPRGSRIISIMNELNNEKIDIIPWSQDALQYIVNALLPAKVIDVQILPRRTIKVLVSEEQIPIALGKAGQNIKLASRLTGWKIDVRLADQPEQEIEGGVTDDKDITDASESEESEPLAEQIPPVATEAPDSDRTADPVRVENPDRAEESDETQLQQESKTNAGAENPEPDLDGIEKQNT